MAFRTDIQALRGLAVLLVVLHHAKLGPFHAGHLGVDVFFVISGYLITGIVKEGVERGTFTFRAFYYRRAKRLLPAAYATFLVTALLAPVMLTSVELNDFARQLAGAVTFTGNIVLWQQTGYFEVSAELKPLLHVWSLAIEEQYYLLLPAGLVLVPRRYWLQASAAILAASLAAYLILVRSEPSAAFYLLPTRAWELAVGSLGALGAFDGARARTVVSWLFLPALATLLVIPVTSIGPPELGADMVVVCVATLVVVVRRHAGLDASAAARALAWFGDFSYSLYLVHWPVFSFINNASVSEPTPVARAIALALALGLGYLLYRGVESPVRRMEFRPPRRLVGALVAISAALLALSYAIAAMPVAGRNYADIRRVNHGFGAACEYAGDFKPTAECSNSDRPRILVWGDSYAMQLVPGIVATTDAGVAQATRSVCGPFVGLAPMALDLAPYNRAWAEQCLRFNQSVIDYLRATPSVEIVVLSSPFGQFIDPTFEGPTWRSLESVGGRLTEREPTVAGGLAAMRRTVDQVRALGKRVVVVAPLPAPGFDVGKCLERKETGKTILGAGSDCRIRAAGSDRPQSVVAEFLRRLPDEAGVDVVRFDDVLCRDGYCATEIDGTFIYRDEGHFSYDGARLVAARMRLGELLQRAAR